MLAIRNILCPTDFSDHSRPAFELASALARDYGATLTVLHVYVPPAVYAPDGIAMPMPSEEPGDARARLAEFRSNDARVRIEHRFVENGSPTEEIVKLAGEANADLIVMGTHGHSGLARFLVGSVAEHVMRTAPCPVLTVRSPLKMTTNAEPATAAAAG